MENRRFHWAMAAIGHRGFALSGLICKEVGVFSLQDLDSSGFMCIMIVLLTFRTQIPSGSLELRVQHDVL
jgi:hypothetical protein